VSSRSRPDRAERVLSIALGAGAWVLFVLGGRIGSWWLCMWPMGLLGLLLGLRSRTRTGAILAGSALLPLPLMLFFFGG